MKKMRLLFATAMILSVAVGCGGGDNTSTTNPTTTTSNPTSSVDINAYPEGYTENSGVGGTNYRKVSSLDMDVNLDDLFKQEGTMRLPSYGKQNILVIAVEFPDYPAETSIVGGKEKGLQDITYAFTGTSEQTGWESLHSYYYKSSYGKLDLDCYVVPEWYMNDLSVTELLAYWPTVSWNQGGNEGYNSSWYWLRGAVEWYRENWEAKGWRDINEFDQDGDGVLDGVWLVNSAAVNAQGSHDFWAFTYWDYNNPFYNSNNYQYDPEHPVAMPYVSCGYNFLLNGGYADENGNKLMDCHTVIHETGHLLGLEDYYTYDTGMWGPAGGADMMDNNVGDHNAFSKTLYGWTDPYIVEGDAEITIKPFQENGDCIIVKNGWNGHAYDEYLILEYYTPTGLNEKDAKEQYMGAYPQLPSASGVKIYHVDARLGVFDYITMNKSDSTRVDAFLKYTDVIEPSVNENGRSVVTLLAHSNTRSRSANKNYYLLHLLEATGRNSFKNDGKMNNSTLFRAGSYFGHKVFKGFTFNDGSELDYVINIKSIDENGATIVFNAKNK